MLQRNDPRSGHAARDAHHARNARLRSAPLLVALSCALLVARGAWAQAAIEDSLPLTDDPSDPIGIDRDREPVAAPSSKAERPGPAPASRARYGPEPPLLRTQVGEALTAPASVRERTHKLSVELASALARVTVELELESSVDKPAEVSYRVPVPADAALYALEVCNPSGCRSGLPQPGHARLTAYDDAVQARPPANTRGLPAGDARLVTDARGSALLLRGAPVSRSQWLQVRASYAAAVSEHAGVLRLSLPGRGMDPRIAPTRLSVHAPGLADVRANEQPVTEGSALEQEPWTAIELRATRSTRAAHAELWRVPCGTHSCLRAYASAPAQTPSASEIFLAIDASPSTEGEARSRLVATVAALLGTAPGGSRVRALRFASQAVPLLAEPKPARELALSTFAPIAYEAELGSSTRFEAAWELIERSSFSQARGKKLVVIVGDGGLTTGPARPFEAARKKGIEVAVVNVSGRPTSAALARGAQLTGGAVIEAGLEADLATRGHDAERLEERLSAVFQPRSALFQVAGTRGPPLELRAGDSLVWQGPPANNPPAIQLGGRSLRPGEPPRALAPALTAHAGRLLPGPGPTLVAVDRADLHARPDRPEGQDAPAQRGVACDRRGPGQRASGLSSDAAPVQLAQERAVCAEPVTKPRPKTEEDEPELGAGMPGSPLLSMLRQRILPMSRGCFRRDRAGRADYQVRAVFEFELADREVVAASVQGQIADELRSCLLHAVDGLLVPRFSGRVLVRYPLVTEREPLPSQVELTAGTAEEVDSVIKP